MYHTYMRTHTHTHTQALGLSIDEDKLKGFWQLGFTNDSSFVSKGGASGLGALPFCYLV